MEICKSCGKANAPESLFCAYCGAAIQKEEKPTTNKNAEAPEAKPIVEQAPEAKPVNSAPEAKPVVEQAPEVKPVNSAPEAAPAPKSEPVAVAPEAAHTKPKKYTGLSFVGALFPFIGVFLWLIWKGNDDARANAVLRGIMVILSFNPIFGFIAFACLKPTNKEIAKPCLVAALLSLLIPLGIALILGIVYLIGAIVLTATYGSVASSATVLLPVLLI